MLVRHRYSRKFSIAGHMLCGVAGGGGDHHL
jgi:hypothetical protein